VNARARQLVSVLGMRPHPERGYYVESYRAPLVLEGLPHGGPRNAATAIYFLLTEEEPATYLHRLRSDELFHLYEGGPLEVLLLFPDGQVEEPRLGLDLAVGERPQLVIPAGTWFAASLGAGASHVLFGCTVAPASTSPISSSPPVPSSLLVIPPPRARLDTSAAFYRPEQRTRAHD
jgi:predicted cupin superfamily sugar epimerase